MSLLRPVTCAHQQPTQVQMANWVQQAWKAIDLEIIRKSFCVCALSNDALEKIGCLKQNDIAHEALLTIQHDLDSQEATEMQVDEADEEQDNEYKMVVEADELKNCT